MKGYTILRPKDIMVWILIAILAIAAGSLALARRKSDAAAAAEAEPWRVSLGEEEPLDLDAIREAEEEWLDDDDGWDEEDGEPAFR